MKKLIFLLLACYISAACHNHESHSHDHNHSHDHAAHDHAAHKHEHEGHDHNHDDHDHAGHAHNHDSHAHKHTHQHEGESCSIQGAIEMSEAEAKTAGVKIMTVKKDSFVQTIPVSGKITFKQNDEYNVVANTSGIINFLNTYTDGKPVAKGEQIASLSSDNIAGGDPVKKTEVTYRIAKEELERKKGLLKENLITQEEYNVALEHYENSRIAHEATLDKQSQKGFVIKSPVGGYAVETLVQNGDFVEAGTPVLRLVRNNKIMLTADVPLRYQKEIRNIKSATFQTEGETAVHHTDSLNGKLLPVASSVSSGGAYISLRWEMNRQSGIWPGSFAKIFLHTIPILGTVVIPATALSEEGGTYYVYIRADKTHYAKRRVTLGASDGNRIQVLEGLDAGEQIVSQGVMCVRQAGMSKSLGGHGHSH